jgi:predicted DNA-binding antitoxin AbrB/MazE fold protein
MGKVISRISKKRLEVVYENGFFKRKTSQINQDK